MISKAWLWPYLLSNSKPNYRVPDIQYSFSTYTEWTTNNILTAKDREKKVYLLAACEEDTDAAICLDLNRIVRSISCRLYNSFSFLQGSINGSFCQRMFQCKILWPAAYLKKYSILLDHVSLYKIGQ
jgi:hypothetical protein